MGRLHFDGILAIERADELVHGRNFSLESTHHLVVQSGQLSGRFDSQELVLDFVDEGGCLICLLDVGRRGRARVRDLQE